MQFPGTFRPYELSQVHATIIGLEGRRNVNDVLNDNYSKLGGSESMDLAGLLNFLHQDTSFLPFRVRIGGFRLGDDYPFRSFERHPYLRSFAIQKSNIVVAMGWPERDGEFPATLNDLRRKFGQFNILHKYHKSPIDIDNDFFFVLGKIDPDVTNNIARDAASESIRARISGIEPVYINVTWEDLSIVAYTNDELPVATSVRIPISEAKTQINEIKALYQEA